jgi:hypothetical protein
VDARVLSITSYTLEDRDFLTTLGPTEKVGVPSNLSTSYSHLILQERAMKIALAAIIVVLSINLAAQQQSPATSQAAAADLNSIVADVQRAALSANGHIGGLRIEKWKTDGTQRQQMQQVAESLQRNITNAIPGLISDLQADPGSVAKAFKLYHNINVVYEFLNSLAEAAGAFGRKEEYDPLASDAAALDNARQNLSVYVERKATTLDAQLKPHPPSNPQTTSTNQQPKKIIVDNDAPSKKTKKTVKKTSPTDPQ